MKRLILPFLAILLFSQVSFSQVDKNQLLIDAQKYTEAYVNQEFAVMADMNHPNMISLGGNKEFVAKDLAQDKVVLEGFGFKFKEGSVEMPSEFHEVDEEVLCFVPQVFLIDLNGEEYQFTKNILASTITNGKSWFFVSLDRFDAASLGDFIPSYSTDIPWPEEVPMVATSAIIDNPLPAEAVQDTTGTKN